MNELPDETFEEAIRATHRTMAVSSGGLAPSSYPERRGSSGLTKRDPAKPARETAAEAREIKAKARQIIAMLERVAPFESVKKRRALSEFLLSESLLSRVPDGALDSAKWVNVRDRLRASDYPAAAVEQFYRVIAVAWGAEDDERRIREQLKFERDRARWTWEMWRDREAFTRNPEVIAAIRTLEAAIPDEERRTRFLDIAVRTYECGGAPDRRATREFVPSHSFSIRLRDILSRRFAPGKGPRPRPNLDNPRSILMRYFTGTRSRVTTNRKGETESWIELGLSDPQASSLVEDILCHFFLPPSDARAWPPSSESLRVEWAHYKRYQDQPLSAGP